MDQLDSHFYNPLHSTRGQVLLYAHYQQPYEAKSATVRIETYICISVRQEYGETVPFRNWSRKLSMRQRVFVDRAIFHDEQKVLVRVCDELNVL
jgi:hypothetical protein